MEGSIDVSEGGVESMQGSVGVVERSAETRGESSEPDAVVDLLLGSAARDVEVVGVLHVGSDAVVRSVEGVQLVV